MYWDIEEETGSPTVPVAPDRGWEFPPDPHVGHAAALNVPRSEGVQGYTFERGTAADRTLIEAESRIEPGRQMEAGTEFSAEAVEALSPLMDGHPIVTLGGPSAPTIR